MLNAISPIDGRYKSKTDAFADYFSEFGLIKYRVFVEIQYFIALAKLPLPQLAEIPAAALEQLNKIASNFSLANAEKIKGIERVTNHDVKAVEYFIKDAFDQLGLAAYKEFIHFALTSQDINNTAIPLSVKEALENVYYPAIESVIENLQSLAKDWEEMPMLARTHGQPASPTRLGKEIQVFVSRLNNQINQLKAQPIKGKFSGATGNFNAHHVAYPQMDWAQFGDRFLKNYLNLERSKPTTQIEHYDDLAGLFQTLMRINNILIDFCRDIWTYISMEYFGQKVIANEVGSSAMPHKVNPIDFENAEGNLGMANAVFNFLANKLPVSRLQRDLTDSTVLRNVGVPFSHTLIALKSIQKGLGKLLLNDNVLEADLEDNWMVIAEAVQNILRREGVANPYEKLKAMTRGQGKLNQKQFHAFIDALEVTDLVKEELKQITPSNYLGILDY